MPGQRTVVSGKIGIFCTGLQYHRELNWASISSEKGLVAFCQKHRLCKLALLGSATRDNYGPQSDVDVVIELPKNHKVGYFQLFDMEQEHTSIFHRKVDLNSFGGLRGAIGEEIRSAAKMINHQGNVVMKVFRV